MTDSGRRPLPTETPRLMQASLDQIAHCTPRVVDSPEVQHIMAEEAAARIQSHRRLVNARRFQQRMERKRTAKETSEQLTATIAEKLDLKLQLEQARLELSQVQEEHEQQREARVAADAKNAQLMSEMRQMQAAAKSAQLIKVARDVSSWLQRVERSMDSWESVITDVKQLVPDELAQQIIGVMLVDLTVARRLG